MANGELIDAREAMDLLGIGENDLQTFVARGDLRAFRSAGTMKFRRDDVLSLKSEKGTEPTIIIPAAGQRKPGQSGILSAVSAGPAGSGVAPAAKTSDATGEIVFDDIELLPTDDGMTTKEGTVVATAVHGIDATVVEGAVGAAQTGEMTVVDGASDEAQVSTGPAQPIRTSGSGRRQPSAVQTGSKVGSRVEPAVSRVRQPSVAVARRTATVYQQKTAHPIMSTILILTAGVMIFTVSILAVMAFKEHYDKDSGERVVPPYLVDLYDSNYEGGMPGRLPGFPKDVRPDGEPPLPKQQ